MWRFISTLSLQIRVAIVLVLFVIVLFAIPLIDMSISRPYQAQLRGHCLKSLMLRLHANAKMSDLPKLNDLDGTWSWRVIIASEGGCKRFWHWDPDHPDPFAAGDCDFASLDQVGRRLFGRVDGTAALCAIRGPGTAYAAGLHNLRNFPPDLIMFVETDDRTPHWMKPFDFNVDDFRMRRIVNPGSEFGRGFHVAFADGAVWYLKKNVPIALLERFVTIDSASKSRRDELLKEFLIFIVYDGRKGE